MLTHHTPSEVEQLAAERRVARALLSLRVSVFLVMLMWALDKLINPDHAARVFKSFYFLGGLGPAAFGVIGLAELTLLTAFLLGIQKRLSYGLVFVFHAVSTVSSYPQYQDPFDNLLFFAAWPMLAACFTLYTLRDLDTIVPRVLSRVRS